MLSFSAEEYKERMKKVRERMSEKGIEVLLVTDPVNIQYLSGYDGTSLQSVQLLVVLQDEDEPFWIGRGQDVQTARETTWLGENQLIPYEDDFVKVIDKHPMDFVCDILHEIGQGNGKIGAEMDTYYFTAGCFKRLHSGLSSVKWIDATNLVNEVRMIKSDQEIIYMKRAGEITETAIRTGMDAIEAGAGYYDMAAVLLQIQKESRKEYGDVVPMLSSWNNTATRTKGEYKLSEPIILAVAGGFRKYYSPLIRTVFLGEPARKMKYAADTVTESLTIALEAIKPGIPYAQAEAEGYQALQNSGYYENELIGYSIGLAEPPVLHEHTGHIWKNDQMILQPNMTLNLLVAVKLDQYELCMSESLRITESGYEPLANIQRELMIKSETGFY